MLLPGQRMAADVVSRTYFWVRIATLALALAACTAIALTGEKRTSFNDFYSAAQTGVIDKATIVGDMHKGSNGASVAEVHYRDGWVNKYAEVIVASSSDEAHTVGLGSEDLDRTTPIIGTTLTNKLRQDAPHLHITTAFDRGGHTTIGSWQGPTWIAYLWLPAGLGWLGLLVNGPEPHRATRWAWFWTTCGSFGAVGMLLYLLVGVPWRNIPTPAPKRLTGGWAFVLFVMLHLSISFGT